MGHVMSFKTNNHYLYLTALGVFLPCCILVLILLYQSKKKDPNELSQNADALYKKVFNLYEQQQYELASELIGSEVDALLTFPEGCSLIVSIFAQLKKMKTLEDVSTKCLSLEDDSGIAYEGLAASLVGQGQGKEAIARLETLAHNRYHDRLFLSLGQLYILENDLEKAGQSLLKVVANSEMWSTWLMRVLVLKGVNRDEAFLTQLVDIICEKKDFYPKVEKNLLKRVNELGYQRLGDKLESRMQRFRVS